MSLWYFLFSGKLILGQSALAVVLIIEMLGSMPTAYAQATPGPTNSTTITRSMQSNEAGPIRPRYAYIDVAAATRIAGLPSNLTQVAGLSNSRIAYLMLSTNQVKVISTSGAQVYLTDLTSALGTRATNRQTLKIYPIANGELIVTVEGSNIGCDNNTGNLFAFLRLSATGTVTTALTNISAATRAYNCYTSMAELSNGNLAFTYQITGDSYALRIFQPNGTAVTSETSIQKTGTGQGTCSSQSVTIPLAPLTQTAAVRCRPPQIWITPTTTSATPAPTIIAIAVFPAICGTNPRPAMLKVLCTSMVALRI
jgi:hypothetical protein